MSNLDPFFTIAFYLQGADHNKPDTFHCRAPNHSVAISQLMSYSPHAEIVSIQCNPPHEDDFNPEEPLPEWAIGKAEGEYVLGAQLPTRDGRRMGNAHIVWQEICDHSRIGGSMLEVVYTILTDAGNTARLTAAELSSAFYPPVYVSDVADVKRKFMRDPEPV